MSVEWAYLRYTDAFNDVGPKPVPTFSNISSCISWARNHDVGILANAIECEEIAEEASNDINN